MKVIHLLPALEEGGVERVVCDLTKALTNAGHSVVVVSRGGRLVPTIEAFGAQHAALELKSKNPLTYFARAGQLRRFLMAERAAAERNGEKLLVAVHSRVPAWLFVWANRTLHLPWISYAHGANSVSCYSEVMTRGDRIVVPSQFLADYLTAHYDFDRTKLRVIPNAVDFARFDPAQVDVAFMAEKRRMWGLQEGDFVSLALGRITPLKGLDAVIRDFAARRQQEPHRKLLIVGGADRDKQTLLADLQALAASLCPSGSVIFAGPQEKIPECLALADEVVSGNTTKPESFGLSVAEAYAMNKPVRVLRCFGGVAEIMDCVERAGCKTLREGIQTLCDFGIMSRQTISTYSEIV